MNRPLYHTLKQAIMGLAMGLLFAGSFTIGSATAKTFAPPHFGYSLEVPDGWQISTPQAYTVILTPPNEAASGFDTIMVMNLHRSEVKKPYAAAVDAAADYVQQIKTQAQNGKILRQSAFRWDTGSSVIVGQQLVVSFSEKGLPIRQWAVFLPNPKAAVIHLWQYTASAQRFDSQLPKARSILDSLQPVEEKDAPASGPSSRPSAPNGQ